MSQYAIERRITSLLQNAAEQFKPDYIVTVERQGTALLRAVIEQGGLDWSWNKVLSTSTISGMEHGYLKDKRVLLFDDSVNHGHSMRRVRDEIVDKFDNALSIATAAFAVHENCQPDIKPDFSYYVGLKDELYEDVRKKVTIFLQNRGSLLLDTEHIEISIDLKGGEDKFCRALASLGRTVKFETLQTLNRNITLLQPFKDSRYYELLKNDLPENSNIDDGVFKCRFVERTGNKIALIPICYPVISPTLTDKDKEKLPDCFKMLISDNEADYKLNFHLVGVYASIKMLSYLFAAFAGEDTRPLIEIDFPEIYTDEKHDVLTIDEKATIKRRDTYSHLLAMFPKMDIVAVKDIVRASVDEGLRNREFYGELVKRDYSQIPLSSLRTYARRLTKAIFDVVQVNKNFGVKSNGASIYEIINYLRRDPLGMNVPLEYFSAAMDQLIDEGTINTDIDMVMSDEAEKRVFRTFKPDGEFVTSKILRNYYDL